MKDEKSLRTSEEFPTSILIIGLFASLSGGTWIVGTEINELSRFQTASMMNNLDLPDSDHPCGPLDKRRQNYFEMEHTYHHYKTLMCTAYLYPT